MNHNTVTLAHAWHENLDDAVADAKKTRRPILSLRLLGRLDHELSCANSRFFKKTLYCDPAVSEVMSREFVLHWEMVRPVPIVTIDFGDGRSLVRTLTGNSAHLILDENGRPVDALPGLYRPALFLSSLAWARRAALAVVDTDPVRADARLAAAHAARLRDTPRPFAPKLPPPAPSAARDAGKLAMTKMRVEQPMLDNIADLSSTMPADEAFNETELHKRVHQRFARGEAERDPRAFTSWIYRELFLMPDDDLWLGLV